MLIRLRIILKRIFIVKCEKASKSTQYSCENPLGGPKKDISFNHLLDIDEHFFIRESIVVI
jgi:hypothetical protein